MLSEKEVEFIKQWEATRVQQSKFFSKFRNGLPMAVLFTSPIIVSIALVYFLSPDWYTKISQSANGSLISIMASIIIIVFFFSYARMHFKWEMNEQLYQELKAKIKSND